MKNFKGIGEQHVRELGCIARVYRHDRTGALLVHLDIEYLQKQFSVSFSTPPQGDIGLSHIVEHMVMCGSRRYSVGAPLMRMKKRGLATYINALTGRECTHYIVSSPVQADLMNLAGVCLDAVFAPLLEESSFLREAHHIHSPAADEEYSGLDIQGVILNEMRAHYALPQRWVLSQAYQRLLPGYPYAYDSSGDPCAIPDVRLSDVKAYHQRYYHPGNCCVVAVGDVVTNELLNLIDSALGAFKRRPQFVAPGAVERWKEPRQFRMTFGTRLRGDQKRQSPKNLAALLWEVGSSLDLRAVVEQQVLADVLFRSGQVRLGRVLRESALAEGLLYTGWGKIGGHAFLQIGVYGYADDSGSTLIRMVGDWLETEVNTKSFEGEVERAFDRIVQKHREITPTLARRLLDGVVTSWALGRDPLDPLSIHAQLEEFRGQIAADANWLPNRVRDWLVLNPHRLEVVALHDSGMADRTSEDVQHRLCSYRDRLGEEGLLKLARAETGEAEGRTIDVDALESLPCLHLSQVIEAPYMFSVSTVLEAKGVRVLRNDVSSNEVAYAAIGFDLRSIDPGLWRYIGRFAEWLKEREVEEDLARRARRLSDVDGDIECDVLIDLDALDRNQIRPWLEIRAKALDRRLYSLLRMVERFIFAPDRLRLEEVQEIAQSCLARRRSEGLRNPVALAACVARRPLTELGRLIDDSIGYGDLLCLQSLAEGTEEALQEATDALERAHEAVAFTCPITVSFVGSDEALDALLRVISNWGVRESTHADSAVPKNRRIAPGGARLGAGLVAARKTGSCAVVLDAPHCSSRAEAPVTVGSRVLGQDLALEVVRMRHGAYRAGCVYDPFKEEIILYSDRDPDVGRTLDTYLTAAAWLAQQAISEAELERAIMLAATEFHRRLSPGETCRTALARSMVREPLEARLVLYEQLLRSSGQDVVQVMQETLASKEGRRSFCVVGSQEEMDRVAHSHHGGGMHVTDAVAF